MLTIIIKVVKKIEQLSPFMFLLFPISISLCACLFPHCNLAFSLSIMCVPFFFLYTRKIPSQPHLIIWSWFFTSTTSFPTFFTLISLISLLYNYCTLIIHFSTMGSMKVHQFARGFWEHEPSLTLGCKRLRPLAPKLANTDTGVTAFDLKSFIRPESGPRKFGSSDDKEKRDPPQVPYTKLSSSHILHAIIHYWFLHVVFFNSLTLTKNDYQALKSYIIGSCMLFFSTLSLSIENDYYGPWIQP
jgi:hypothetical protein